MGEYVIEVEGLVKRFRALEAVRGVSLTVRQGEIFGFLGPNGAGKSTTIKMLCTLLRPTAGRALVAGYDVRANPHQVRRQIGLVFQDTTLDERLTARENLVFHTMLYGLAAAERERRLAEVLEMVELADRAGDLVRTFSGGMKRRLEIARGLTHYPRVLFLDEPTTGLDPQTRSHIWRYIHALRKRENLTIFLTTHYMDEAENCDRIAVIDHGRIIAQGTPGELKRSLGGDVITVRTGDDAAAAERLAALYGRAPLVTEDGLQVQVADGEREIPRLVEELRGGIQAVSLRRPTLDDVFLHLTGHAIRQEGPEAAARSRRRVHHA